MPTYQYACTECEHTFEQVQSFSDDALTECPQCHGRLRKLFNAVGVVFKGSGFYRTDSRADARTAAASASSSNGSSTNGSLDQRVLEQRRRRVLRLGIGRLREQDPREEHLRLLVGIIRLLGVLVGLGREEVHRRRFLRPVESRPGPARSDLASRDARALR